MCFRQLSQYYIHQQLHIENPREATQNFLTSKILDILCRRLSEKGEEDESKNIIDETPLTLPRIYKNEGHQEILKLPEFNSLCVNLNMINH